MLLHKLFLKWKGIPIEKSLKIIDLNEIFPNFVILWICGFEAAEFAATDIIAGTFWKLKSTYLDGTQVGAGAKLFLLHFLKFTLIE